MIATMHRESDGVGTVHLKGHRLVLDYVRSERFRIIIVPTPQLEALAGRTNIRVAALMSMCGLVLCASYFVPPDHNHYPGERTTFPNAWVGKPAYCPQPSDSRMKSNKLATLFGVHVQKAWHIPIRTC